LFKNARLGTFRNLGLGLILGTIFFLAGSNWLGGPWRWLAVSLPALGLALDLVLAAYQAGQRSEKALLRSIVDHIPFLISVRNDRREIQLVNKHLAELCGISVQDLESGQDLPAWLKGDCNADPDGPPDLEMEFCSEVINEHGEARNILISHQAIQPGHAASSKCLTVGIDMTEQHQAELSLARGLVAERTQTGILRRLVQGRHESFQEDLEKALSQVAEFCHAEMGLLAQREDEGMARIVAFAAKPGGASVPDLVMEELFSEAIARLKQDQHVVLRNIRQKLNGKQGQFFSWNRVLIRSLILVPVFDQGELCGCLGVHSRRRDKEWSNLEISMLRVVAEVMSAAWGRHRVEASLKETTEAARASNAAKSQFLANMSHEIRTPLNCVMGLSDHLFDLDPTEEQQQCLNLIRHSGDVLLNVINDILDLARIESGKVPLQLSDIKLDSLLKNTMGMFKGRAEEKGLNLDLRLDPLLPDEVRTDEVRLSQILTNLIGNAIKFTAEGSVTLVAEPVGPSGSDLHPWIRFRVEDTGIGIDDNKLDLIFDSFTQADASTTRNYGGTGLGLAISRSLADLMEGELTATSEVGAGSNFILELPMSVALGETDLATGNLMPNPTQVPTELPPGLKVLVVEDNIMNQVVAERILSSQGCEVMLADHGQQALDQLATLTVDLVLMDYMMPGMDGPETTRRLRALGGRFAEIPVVALTANALDSHQQECLAAGMDGFLTKPIRKHELLKVLASLPKATAPA